MEIKTFDAAYGRQGSINLELAVCDVCKVHQKCVTIDSSEGEYGPGAICKLCIDAAFLHAEEANG